MKTHLATEISSFLADTGISARKLAREAKVTPSSVLHIVAGTRQDMRSANADKVREAMKKLREHLHSPPPLSPESNP